MPNTIIAAGDAKALKRFGVALLYETATRSFTGRNLMASDGSMPILRITDLESGPGDQVTIDLFRQLSGAGREGDVEYKGFEERMTADTGTMLINILFHGVNLGGYMTRKRTKHNLRTIAKRLLATWWSRRLDEMSFVQMSGVRGSETANWLLPTDYNGFAGNGLAAGTSGRTIMPSGAGGTEGNIDSSDVVDIPFLEDISDFLKTTENPLEPLMINGREMYLMIMSPRGEKELRTATGSTGWAGIRNQRTDLKPYFQQDALGVWGNLVLFSHNKIPKTNTGNSVAVARNLVLGANAMAFAKGNAGQGGMYEWHEELDNRGKNPVVDTFGVFGMKRIDMKMQDGDSTATEYGVVHALSYGGPTVS